jgi:hypothetical protein
MCAPRSDGPGAEVQGGSASADNISVMRYSDLTYLCSRLTALVVTSALTVLCSTIEGAHQSQPATGGERLILFSVGDETGSLEYGVSRRIMAATRSWSPESQPPPLPIDAAVAIARRHANLPESAHFMMTGIQLQPCPIDMEGAVRWFYSVEYYDARDLYADKPPSGNRVVILMDGTIVQPVKSSRRF